MDINLIYVILLAVIFLGLFAAPYYTIKTIFIICVIGFLIGFLTGCQSENWSFTPNAKIKTDEISRDKPTKGIEIEEVQGQIEYKF